MDKVELLDRELYLMYSNIGSYKKKEQIWNKIKNDKEVLNEAIKVVRNNANTADIVKGIAISFEILKHYNDIDKDIYNNLISVVLSNKDLATLQIFDHSMMLETALYNHNLNLNKKQKEFVLSIAYSNNFTELDYHILRNNSWIPKEKKELINKLYTDEEIFNDIIYDWEWTLLNNISSYGIVQLEHDFLYDYSYEDILANYEDKLIADKIWNEIEFLKEVKEMRDSDLQR